MLLPVLVLGLSAKDHGTTTNANHEQGVKPATMEGVIATNTKFVNFNAMVPLSERQSAHDPERRTDRVYLENHTYKALGGILGFGGVGYALINGENAKLITSAYGTYGEHAGGGLGIRFLGRKNLKNNLYLITDAHLLQSLSRHGLNNSRTFLDPTHVSVGYKWLQIGFSAEYLHHGIIPAPADHHHAEEVEEEPDHELGKGFRIFIEASPTYGFGYRANKAPHGWAHLFFTEYRLDFKRLLRRR